MSDESERRESDLELIREQFVDFIRIEYGTDKEGLRKFTADMQWISRQRAMYTKISQFVIWPAVALIILGIVTWGMTVFSEGLKALRITHGSG